ncbi:transferase family-domain-containing protein [Mortierella sp. GBAus27b]|nr:hypothetical protein BGX31_003517 [Mortierella sp. GBA43]KAI8348757.1 transferase family-domain-containing protein [Mortierella sp. GBAus27b]
MTPERAPQEPEKNTPRLSSGPTFAAPGPSARSSSASLNSRFSPSTKLRYRQLVQPITPTELESVGLAEHTAADKDDGTTPSEALRHPRIVLSSFDLAKPRIYTRLLYFFQSNDSSPSPLFESSELPEPSSSRGEQKSQSKARHHYHYHQTPFMDPMLLQASLALVLTDFFPLAGRIYSHHSPSAAWGSGGQRPFIECNDRGVLFVVADTNVTMEQIRRGCYQDAVLPPRLFPVGLYPASLRDPPLLAIQVTYTQDRSLIMGVAADSSVMDGVSLVSFMEAWSKITQGQDFAPYPVLDRSILEQYGEAYCANGVYRHQRINNSPPPSIGFDHSLDSDLARGLADSDFQTDDEDEEDEGDEEDDGNNDEKGAEEAQRNVDIGSGNGVSGEQQHGNNMKRIHKRMQNLSVVAGSTEAADGMVTNDGRRGSRSGHHARPSHHHHHHYHKSSQSQSRSRNLHLIHFTPQQLDRIKKLASEQNIAAAACAADDKEISDKWVSTGDSLIAYLWKFTTITRRMEPDCKLMCGVVMDVRERTNPTLPKGFFGNAIMTINVQMPVHSLLTTPLSLPSRLLRDEIMLQTHEQICSSIQWIQRQEQPHLIETDSNNPFGHDFTVWSFRKLNMYSVDFGQGRPIKVRIGRGGFGGGEGMCIIMDSEPMVVPSKRTSSLPTGSGGSSSKSSASAALALATSTTGGAVGTTATGDLPPCGVDVYMGLQGEVLRDFYKVHRGFMNGLLEYDVGGSSMGDWEFV